jgi:hypothetical protein
MTAVTRPSATMTSRTGCRQGPKTASTSASTPAPQRGIVRVEHDEIGAASHRSHRRAIACAPPAAPAYSACRPALPRRRHVAPVAGDVATIRAAAVSANRSTLVFDYADAELTAPRRNSRVRQTYRRPGRLRRRREARHHRSRRVRVSPRPSCASRATPSARRVPHGQGARDGRKRSTRCNRRLPSTAPRRVCG